MLQPIVAREREALGAHRASLRGGELPAPRTAPRGTFVHGLLLPVSILAATLRDRDLRGPFLRLFAVRTGILLVAAVVALLVERDKHADVAVQPTGVTVERTDKDGARQPTDLDVPGLHVHLDHPKHPDEVVVLGQSVPMDEDEGKPSRNEGKAARHWTHRPATGPLASLARRWAAVVAFVGLLSVLEGILVFFSRRWDDWTSFHISRLAGIRPETPDPPARKVAVDLKWIVRKLRRRVRGYFIFGSGLPLLYLLKLVPVAGGWLFAAAATLWAWYWVGVFTASKSALAWSDAAVAVPPRLVRAYATPFARGWWWWPMRLYGRIWAWLVKGVNAPAAVFDRTPAPYLGLALARAVFALPGLYLLMRPIVPVASGRLCAEADPQDRFSLP